MSLDKGSWHCGEDYTSERGKSVVENVEDVSVMSIGSGCETVGRLVFSEPGD